METRRKPQLLMSLIVLSVLFSQMSAWPLFEAQLLRTPLEEENEYERALINFTANFTQKEFPENGRSARHANEIFTSDLSRDFDPFSDNLEVFNEKRDIDDIAENLELMKRQADLIFTDEYTRLLKQIAVKKYLEKVLKQQSKEEEQKKN